MNSYLLLSARLYSSSYFLQALICIWRQMAMDMHRFCRLEEQLSFFWLLLCVVVRVVRIIVRTWWWWWCSFNCSWCFSMSCYNFFSFFPLLFLTIGTDYIYCCDLLVAVVIVLLIVGMWMRLSFFFWLQAWICCFLFSPYFFLLFFYQKVRTWNVIRFKIKLKV